MANPSDPKRPASPSPFDEDPTPGKPKPSDEELAKQAEEDAFAELMAADELTELDPASSRVDVLGPTEVVERMPTGSESVIDLGKRVAAPQPPSGESSFEWADLVGQPPSTDSSQLPRIDAPSDASVIQRALEREGHRPVPQDEDAFEPRLADRGAESSHISLFDAPPAEDPLRSRPLPAADVEVISHTNLNAPMLAMPVTPAQESASEEVIDLAEEEAAEALLLDSGEAIGTAEVADIEEKAPFAETLMIDSPSRPPAPPRAEPDSTLLLDAPEQPEDAENAAAAMLLESGIDLGAPGVVDVTAPPVESTIDLNAPAVEEIGSGMPVESAVDLGSSLVEDVTGAAPAVESAIDLNEPVVEEFVASPAGESAVDLGANFVEDVAEPASADASAVLVGGAQLLEDQSDDALDALPQVSSASDVLVAADRSDPRLVEGSGLAEIVGGEGEAIDLAGAAPGTDSASSVNLEEIFAEREKGSSRDLIAEAVESGVDLPSSHAEIVMEEDATEQIVLGAEGPKAEESSAVDLGAMPLVSEEEPGAEELALEQFQQADDAEAVAEAVEADDVEETLYDVGGAALIDDEELAGAEAVAGAAPLDDLDLSELPSPGDGSGNVEFGGAAELSADSAEGTLEDNLDEFTEEVAEEVAAGDLAAEDEEGLAVTEAAEEDGLTAADAEDATATQLIAGDGEATTEEGLGLGLEEEAVAVADEEAAAAAEDEDEYIPPPPPPSFGFRWVAAALFGMIIATAACAGIALFQPDLIKQLQALLPADENEQTGDKRPDKDGKKPGPTPGAKVADLKTRLDQDDFTDAEPTIDDKDMSEVARRGQFRWLKYLASAPPPYNANAPAVVDARKDLETVIARNADAIPKNLDGPAADALYWQGHILETLDKTKEAEEVYKNGIKLYAGKPQEGLFQGALSRLAAVKLPPTKAVPPAGAGALLTPTDDLFFPLMLAWAPAQMPDPVEVEAGDYFWRALEAARKGDYKDVDKLLDQALAEHERRRAKRRLKAQNPKSDPTEQIFIESVKELKGWFELQRKMKSGGSVLLAQDDYMKLLEGKEKAEKEAVKLKKDLMDEKTLRVEAEKKQTTAETALADEKKKSAQLDADLLVEQALRTATQDNLLESTLEVETLTREKKDRDDTIMAVGDKLLLPDIDPVLSKKVLFQRLDDTVAIAKTNNPQGLLLTQMEELRNLQATLKERWPPEVMLGYWLPLLGDRSRKDIVDSALRDVERVRANPKAPLDVRGHAATVEGLALRNRGDYPGARKALDEALRGDIAGPTWRPVARDLHKELNDPTASFLPRAEELRSRQQFDEAVALLDEGALVFPDKAGELLALRSLTRLEKALASAAGKLAADAPGLKEALADADLAVQKGATGPGQFARGRILEELGQKQEAEKSYRLALQALPEAHPDVARAKLGLTRILLQGIEFKPAVPPMPKDAGGKLERGLPNLRFGRLTIPSVVPLVVAQVPAPDEEAKIKEALKLADEVLARPDIDQFPLLKAQALAVKGMWTQSLNEYVKGLKPHLSREHYEGLKYIVENHPLQRTPDVFRERNPLLADKLYASGLTRFFNREFAAAEKDFARAIGHFEQDARFHYFLGLAKLAQNKRGVVDDFDRAARWEVDNRPNQAAVNASLERIQGVPRQMINEARERNR